MSRAPKSKPNKYSPNIEQLVLKVRNELIATPFSQYGPQAIYYRLKQENVQPPPVWTIARILKRNELTMPKKKKVYISKGKNLSCLDGRKRRVFTETVTMGLPQKGYFELPPVRFVVSSPTAKDHGQ
jgi:hypothetical protein